MKAVIQRCLSASVTVDGAVSGEIGQGLLVLLGVGEGDTEKAAELMAAKVAALRIFTDADDKMNLSVRDVGGSVLAVSNFTLMADTKKGNRPSFIGAMRPEGANPLYEHFCKALREAGVPVGTGVFGADMQVHMVGDGPVTIVLDTDTWMRS